MALFDSGTPIANVALTDTFNTWRLTTNQINTQAAGLASNNTFTGINSFANLQADAIDFDGDLTVDDVTANTVTSASIVVSGIAAGSVIVGAGASSATGVSPGASGQVLTSNGTVWLSQASTGGSESYRYQYTATAAQTSFNATYDVGFVDVFLNGSKLLVGTDFTASTGSTVVLTVGATVGDIVDIMAFGSFSVADVYSQAASDARFAQLSNNLSDLASATTARTNLGVEIGTDVQAFDADTTKNDVSNTFTVDQAITAELKADSYNEAHQTVTSTSNATTVNCEAGNSATHTLTENTTFTFANPPATGTAFSFSLKIVQDSGATGYAVTWPAAVDWPAATAPTLTATASAVDVFVFATHDGGTTWYGFTAGQALA
tara:strand:+ start:2874 stop:4004 length:1131 start_codon:yes stop_codon:yes gene_type:complete